ncbi:hypothetical protein WJX73_000404 [Symbiochloris irregularis]|uniref:F-box domain-containing protein n=1 Tax=Symbiochloris irregularis TaxID=706552 RepID=A0AAW1NQP6_9CHLO
MAARQRQDSVDTGLPLPWDLQTRILSLLDFRTQIQCERVCKAFNSLLRRPEAKIWSTVSIDHRNSCPLFENPGFTANNATRLLQRCEPILRWLTERQRGLTFLNLNFGSCRTYTGCGHRQRHLAVLLGCLNSVNVDLKVVSFGETPTQSKEHFLFRGAPVCKGTFQPAWWTSKSIVV